MYGSIYATDIQEKSSYVPLVKSSPSERSKLATCPPVELSKVSVRKAPPVTSIVVSPPVSGMFVSEMVKSENVFAPVNVCVPSRKANVPFVPRLGRVNVIEEAGFTAVTVISFASSTVVDPSKTRVFPLFADESEPVKADPVTTLPNGKSSADT